MKKDKFNIPETEQDWQDAINDEFINGPNRMSESKEKTAAGVAIAIPCACYDCGMNQVEATKMIEGYAAQETAQLREALKELIKVIEYGELELRTTYERHTNYKGSSSLWVMQEALKKYSKFNEPAWR